MKFSSKEDIEAPIAAVFDMVTDFPAFERAAIRRGAEVQRTDSMTAPGVGMSWDVRFTLRGRPRQVTLVMAAHDPPERLLVDLSSQGVSGVFEVDLLALSRSRTRLAVALELRPRTLPARLLIQSMKLAKTRLTKRFKLRVADYSREMEERYGRGA